MGRFRGIWVSWYRQGGEFQGLYNSIWLWIRNWFWFRCFLFAYHRGTSYTWPGRAPELANKNSGIRRNTTGRLLLNEIENCEYENGEISVNVLIALELKRQGSRNPVFVWKIVKKEHPGLCSPRFGYPVLRRWAHATPDLGGPVETSRSARKCEETLTGTKAEKRNERICEVNRILRVMRKQHRPEGTRKV